MSSIHFEQKQNVDDYLDLITNLSLLRLLRSANKSYIDILRLGILSRILLPEIKDTTMGDITNMKSNGQIPKQPKQAKDIFRNPSVIAKYNECRFRQANATGIIIRYTI